MKLNDTHPNFQMPQANLCLICRWGGEEAKRKLVARKRGKTLKVAIKKLWVDLVCDGAFALVDFWVEIIFVWICEIMLLSQFEETQENLSMFLQSFNYFNYIALRTLQNMKRFFFNNSWFFFSFLFNLKWFSWKKFLGSDLHIKEPPSTSRFERTTQVTTNWNIIASFFIPSRLDFQIEILENSSGNFGASFALAAFGDSLTMGLIAGKYKRGRDIFKGGNWGTRKSRN